MREKIDITEALRLYETLKHWGKVARWLTRKTRVPFTADAVRAAVRRHDRGLA